jgi:hypothetical protein
MRPIVRPAIDPLAHKAAIDALEAQRATYRRFARSVEGQTARVNDGDGDKAVLAADVVARGFGELEANARALEPLVRDVRDSGSAEALVEVERQMAELALEARKAETAIQNLALQLEAWRDAYGRQLAESGLVPGGEPGDDAERGGAPAPPAGRDHPYRSAGSGARAGPRRAPSLIDRRG